MALSYTLRLVFLVAVSMGLLQVVFELLLWASAPGILRVLPTFSLRQRERALYLVQFLPFCRGAASARDCSVSRNMSRTRRISRLRESAGSVFCWLLDSRCGGEPDSSPEFASWFARRSLAAPADARTRASRLCTAGRRSSWSRDQTLASRWSASCAHLSSSRNR